MIREDGIDLPGGGSGVSVAVRITEAGTQELKFARRGLSVWQRRLLHALQEHEHLEGALESDPMLRRPQVASDLARLIHLELLVRERSATAASKYRSNGDDDDAGVRRRGGRSALRLGRRSLLAIGAAAVCIVAALAYLLLKPATKAGKSLGAPLAASSEPQAQSAPTPIVARKPDVGTVAELPLQPPPSAQQSNAASSLPAKPSPIVPPPSIPAESAPKTSVAAAKEPTEKQAAVAKPKPAPQAPPAPAIEKAKPDSPRERPPAAQTVAPLAARTEPTLRKSQPCPQPTYPPESLKLREEGTVVFRFLIDVDGNVAEAKIDSSSGSSRLDQAARDVLSRCRFVPGTVNGKPEPSWASLRYIWRLD